MITGETWRKEVLGFSEHPSISGVSGWGCGPRLCIGVKGGTQTAHLMKNCVVRWTVLFRGLWHHSQHLLGLQCFGHTSWPLWDTRRSSRVFLSVEAHHIVSESPKRRESWLWVDSLVLSGSACSSGWSSFQRPLGPDILNNHVHEGSPENLSTHLPSCGQRGWHPCHLSWWVFLSHFLKGVLSPFLVGVPVTFPDECSCHLSWWMFLSPLLMGVPITFLDRCSCYLSWWVFLTLFLRVLLSYFLVGIPCLSWAPNLNALTFSYGQKKIRSLFGFPESGGQTDYLDRRYRHVVPFWRHSNWIDQEVLCHINQRCFCSEVRDQLMTRTELLPRMRSFPYHWTWSLPCHVLTVRIHTSLIISSILVPCLDNEAKRLSIGWFWAPREVVYILWD